MRVNKEDTRTSQATSQDTVRRQRVKVRAMCCQASNPVTVPSVYLTMPFGSCNEWGEEHTDPDRRREWPLPDTQSCIAFCHLIFHPLGLMSSFLLLMTTLWAGQKQKISSLKWTGSSMWKKLPKVTHGAVWGLRLDCLRQKLNNPKLCLLPHHQF